MSTQSWVYVWVRCAGDRGAIYIGATSMDPETRAWLHLHHDDPEIGRVLARIPARGRNPFKYSLYECPTGSLVSPYERL